MEVQVDVVFMKGETEWKQPAFWKGGNTWTVRFAFPENGTFTYRVESNDPSLDGKTGKVEVQEYEGNNRLIKHGHLRVSENKRYFQHADGTPFFWLADTWWKCLSYRLPWQDFQTLADDRSAKGFSAIQIVAGLYPEEPPFDKRGENEGGWAWEENYDRINTDYFDLHGPAYSVSCRFGTRSLHCRLLGLLHRYGTVEWIGIGKDEEALAQSGGALRGVSGLCGL